MEEMKKEIESLRSQVKTLRILYLATLIIVTFSIISLQMQYSRIRSFYQSTVDTNQEILMGQSYLSDELEQILSGLQTLFQNHQQKESDKIAEKHIPGIGFN